MTTKHSTSVEVNKTKVLKSKQKKNHRAFFDFKGNKFAKLAREYHHELRHLTSDLMDINQRIQNSAILCHQQISFLHKKERHMLSGRRPMCFDDTLYHLENFSFRVTGYRDKMVQFINQALRIGFDERASGVLGTIVSHGTVRDARIDTEIKKFDKDKDFKECLSERILMTHRRYYNAEGGYSTMLIPVTETKDAKEKLKVWKKNIETKVNRANRIVLKTLEMNDKVVSKINDYLTKHPIR